MALWHLMLIFVFHLDIVFSLLREGDEGVCVIKNHRRRVVKSLACCTYWEYDKASKTCKPQCLYSCGEGKCVAPNKCGCDPPSVYVNYTCVLPEPTCSPACANATCTSENTCTCIAGYTHRDTHTCIPQCSKSCINADCLAPDRCVCYDGYKSKSAWECEPVCTDCEHGVCAAPNVCTCNEGFMKRDGKCVPKCDKGCVHGFCSGPNICECDRGYEADLQNGSECKPICDSCVNGDCLAPNVCVCRNGYTKVDGVCIPHCSRPCLNGVCSGPNTCTCDKGYEVESDNVTCRAVCSPACINATCEAPDQCKCLDGFIKSSDFVCKPKCPACEHGTCTSPTICMCNKGYNMINGTCKPVCPNGCVNGFCTEPKVCSCNDGYSRNSTHSTICQKSCVGCDNGTCIDGVCTCGPGFEYLNSKCTPNIVDCYNCNSNCTDGDCWCSDGSPCTFMLVKRSAVAESSTRLAGLEMSWLLGGIVIILLLTAVVITIGHLSRRDYVPKEDSKAGGNPYGSVAYTVAGTLQNRSYDPDKVPNLYSDTNGDDDTKEASNGLLPPDVVTD